MGLIVIGAVVLLLLLYVGATYNRLVGLRVRSENAWSDIDVQLKRRHDLVPNLVSSVKGYAAHEQETLDRVIRARNTAMAATGPGSRGAAETQLSQALRQVFALAESYPQLRAVESFTSLQHSLQEIEDHIQNARRYYNAVVRDLNTAVAQFPSNLVAGSFGFAPREFFEIGEAERSVPDVEFGADAPPAGSD